MITYKCLQNDIDGYLGGHGYTQEPDGRYVNGEINIRIDNGRNRIHIWRQRNNGNIEGVYDILWGIIVNQGHRGIVTESYFEGDNTEIKGFFKYVSSLQNPQPNADFLFVNNKIIFLDRLDQEDEKELCEILDKIDSPRSVFKYYAKNRDGRSTKEVKFFKDIKENYETLREKEYDNWVNKMNNKSKHKPFLFSFSVILGFIIPVTIYGINELSGFGTCTPFNSLDDCMFLVAFIALMFVTFAEILELELNFMSDKWGELELFSLFIVSWSFAYMLLYGILNAELRHSFELSDVFVGIFIGLVPIIKSISLKNRHPIYSRKNNDTFKIFPVGTTWVTWILAGIFGIELHIPGIYLPLIWVLISSGIFILKIVWYSHKDKNVGKMYEMLGALFKDAGKTNGGGVKANAHDFSVLIGKDGLISRWWALEVEKGENEKTKLTRKNKKIITIKLIRRGKSYQICVSDIGLLCYKIKNN